MKYLNKKALIPTLLAVLFTFASCRNPNDQPTTENEITEGGESIITEITSEEPPTTSETTSATTESATTDTSAATEEPPTTEPPKTEPPELETTTSVSETAESQTTATTTEQTTITAEETTAETEETTVTEPEIEPIEGLPDMVFAYLYCFPGSYEIIYGYFIDNTGAVKKYKIEIKYQEDLDYLTDNPHDKNRGDANYGNNLIKERYENLIDTAIETDVNIEKSDLLKLYDELLAVDNDSEITGVKVVIPDQNVGLEFENFYGIRTNEGGGDRNNSLRRKR